MLPGAILKEEGTVPPMPPVARGDVDVRGAAVGDDGLDGAGLCHDLFGVCAIGSVSCFSKISAASRSLMGRLRRAPCFMA